MRLPVIPLFALALGLILIGAPSASAHTLSESHSVWEINGRNIDAIVTLPVKEADRVGSGAPAPSDASVESYLAARVYPTAGGVRCTVSPPIQVLSAAPGFRRFDFTFRCPSAADLKIHWAAFFDLVTSHTDFAEIQNETTGEFAEQLLTRDHPEAEISGGEGNRLKSASFLEFVGMGMMHIFTGVDHMAFLLGLVLISRRLRDLVFVVSGFTIGHSLTLALAVTGVIRPHAEYIDALVALTIALIGAENIAVQTGKPGLIAAGLAVSLCGMALIGWLGVPSLPPLLLLGAGLFTANYVMLTSKLVDAARFRVLITLVFGLVHGFGFAADLLQMQLPTARLAELLVGFNLGVEAGQLSLVIGVSLLVWLLSKVRLATPRAITVDVAASFLIGLGLFWFVARSYA